MTGAEPVSSESTGAHTQSAASPLAPGPEQTGSQGSFVGRDEMVWLTQTHFPILRINCTQPVWLSDL